MEIVIADVVCVVMLVVVLLEVFDRIAVRREQAPALHGRAADWCLWCTALGAVHLRKKGRKVPVWMQRRRWAAAGREAQGWA